ncbi:MAG: amino acid adenylation domain-containing protein [Gammaproteobacteria bacterium]|nr:amino acid adenylation domain-containing protein [Gammaproteobacteria bacterium]
MYVAKKVKGQAELTPNKIALRMKSGEHSYSQLMTKVSKVANALQKQGCEKGDIIGVTCERTETYIISLLAIHTLGAAFLPINASLPSARIQEILAQVDLRLLITLISPADIPVPQISYDALLKQTPTAAFVPPVIEAQDLAYILFTSGSTGTPKGVKISQGALATFVDNIQDKIGVAENDVLFAQSAFSFDVSLSDIFWPLANGAAIYLSSQDELNNPFLLMETLDTENITILQSTSSWYRYLFSAGWKPQKKYKIICGGEAFPSELTESLLGCATSLWNIYGPTEAAIWVSTLQILSPTQEVTLGEVFDGNQLSILDSDGSDSGELVITGSQVALGYISLNEKDHARFVVDPITRERAYKTGDLVTQNAAGQLVCLGRVDRQIKIRGYRVELDEIEAVILKVSGVDKTAVVYRKDLKGLEKLVGFVVCSDTKIVEASSIRELCGNSLPDYMLPSQFVFLEKIPVNANFKTDYNKLKLSLEESEKSYEENRKGTVLNERLGDKIRMIWEEHLSTSVSLQDNFFEVGGNSLIAIRIIVDIKKLNGTEITLDLFLKHPVLSQFLAQVDGGLMSDTPSHGLLIPLKLSSESTNNIYFIHAVGGHVVNYYGVANHLDVSTSAYGLRALGIDGKDWPLQSIEAMASRYIQEIRKIQSKGPYQLAGGSMGGLLAFEIACQLQASNESVSKLLMFDSYSPVVYLPSQGGSDGILRRIHKRTTGKPELRVVRRLASAVYNLLSMRLYIRFIRLLGRTCMSLGFTVPEAYRYDWVKDVNEQALNGYRPSMRYEGDVYMIKAGRGNALDQKAKSTDWLPYISGEMRLELLENASHDALVEDENLPALVQKILRD